MADPFDYLDARDTADSLISDFGQTVIVRKVSNSGTPYAPTQTPTDYPTPGVVIEYTLQQMKDSDVQGNDRRALISAGPLTSAGVTEIKAPDCVVVNGVVAQVVIAKPLNPAGTVVMYDVQLRF